ADQHVRTDVWQSHLHDVAVGTWAADFQRFGNGRPRDQARLPLGNDRPVRRTGGAGTATRQLARRAQRTARRDYQTITRSNRMTLADILPASQRATVHERQPLLRERQLARGDATSRWDDRTFYSKAVLSPALARRARSARGKKRAACLRAPLLYLIW